MKLAFFDAKEGDAEQLAIALPEAEVEVVPAPLHEAVDQYHETEIISIFTDSEAPAEVLKTMPNLKMIAARSAGYDHIDVDYCREHDITVATVPHYGENTVAEYAFALILALSRKLFQSYERTEKMNFDREGLTGFDLKSRTLGVVGTGHIGLNVVSIGRGFGMNVVAFDVKPQKSQATKLGFNYVASLVELLAQSDVISLHVPYLPATRHLINADNLQSVKLGAILVNTARGGLVDTKALLQSLKDGRLSGAGLDVLEEEHDAHDRTGFLSQDEHSNEELITLLHNHELVSRDDVIITPHNAYNSEEAIQRIFDTTIDNITTWLHHAPINVVT